MSFLYTMDYLLSYAMFGLVYWLCGGLLGIFISIGIHTTGNTWDLLNYYWHGSIVVFVIFSGIWLLKKYNENKIIGGV